MNPSSFVLSSPAKLTAGKFRVFVMDFVLGTMDEE
jgi:hypothetical protein